MKIVLVAGNSRAGSQNLKVTEWLNSQLKGMGVETEVVDLHKIALPLQHEEIWGEIDSDPVAIRVREILESADGFVITTSEWNGMVPPALKNLFVYVKYTMAHKPAYLVGVSNTRGGAYPIAELRMNSSKNTYVNYIPEHLIVRDVNDVMNDNSDHAEDDADNYVRSRGIYGLKLLVKYAESLKAVRESGLLDYEKFAHGM